MWLCCLLCETVFVGNGAGPDAQGAGADNETDINLEVSFSEQALIYKEGLKVAQPRREADDRLPVSNSNKSSDLPRRVKRNVND